jgi:hypothetical protein
MRHLLVSALVLALPVAVSAQSRIVADIRSELGGPLPGVRVTVLHKNGGGIVGECWTVGSAGCAIPVEAFRRYLIRADAPGQVPQQHEIETVAGDRSAVMILATANRVILTKPDPTNTTIIRGVIAGVVRSLADEPLAGVAVLALRDGMYDGASSTTGEDGSFRISVAPGTYTVRSNSTVSIRAQQFIEGAAYGAPLTVASSHVTGPVMLYAGSFNLPDVNVTVVTPAGRPVVGAEVIDSSQWRSSTGSNHSVNGKRVSGPNGVVAIPAALPGPIVITATATVDGDHQAGMMVAEVGGETLNVILTLGLAAEVTGRVEFTGLPRPLHNGNGLRVFSDPGPARSGYSPTDTNGLVGADGTFVLKGLVGERCLALRDVPFGWRLAEISRYGRALENRLLVLQPGEKAAGVVLRVEPTTLDASAFPPDPPCPVTRPER